jgi:large repetitive protein
MHRVRMSRRSPLLGFGLAWACLLALLIVPATAAAAGSPAIDLSVGAPTSILYGANATVTLTAENPAKQPYGYNLSYRAVLPEGISYVAGSGHTSAGALEPQIIAGEPESGKTTLIFANVSDLSPASSNALSFQVKHSTSHFTVGGSYTVEAGAYIAEAARYLPKFSATGAPEGPSSTSFTGFATGSATSTISALEIKQAEESPEGEILRGVHDHQVTYKLTVTNTSVGATGKVIVDDWLPADLEYLGCGGAGADHTTDAPTNSPSAEEYPGSGPVIVPTLGGCLTPAGVETLSIDPDGGEEDPTAVYTHVSWDLGTLAAGETKTFEFRAAVPLRENTTTWPAPTGEPTVASGEQATNLNNNSGKETTDGESVITFAKASGDYTETVPVSASEHLKRMAKDLTIEKSASSKTLAEGQVTQWTLTLNSSEYRYNTDAVVTDTVPNGLCPLSSTNLSSPLSGECEPDTAPSSPYFSAVEEANGTWKLVWNTESDAALAEVPENGETTITYYTKTRTHYQSEHKASTPILADDTITNAVLAQATTNVVCGKDTDCSGGEKTPINHERPLSEAVSDGSSASQSSAGPSITKEIAKSGTACLADEYTTSIPIFHPGDLICWRLIATFPTTIETKGLNVTDFLPIADTFDEAFEEKSEKGQARGTGDTLPGTTFDHSEASSSVPGGSIAWTLPEEGHVTKEKQRFERVYATNAKLPHEATPGELQGNLMKFANVNTPGASFSYRAEADYALQFPQLSLTKEVVALNGSAFGPASTAIVKGGDKAEFALIVSNAGELEAINTEVWDNLPNGLQCSEISVISNGGSCASGRITWGDTGLGQPAIAVAAKGQTVLHFTVTVPISINPATALEDHAGVVEYHSATNTGGEYTYVPTEDIDTTIGLEPNVPAANANAKLETEAAILEKTHTSSVIETGNKAAEASIGELVTFEVSATLPAGTAFGGEAQITDPGIPTTRLTYETGSAEALVDGSAAPAEFKVKEVSGSPVLVLPEDYTAPGAAARKITLRFKARVTNVSENNAVGSATEKNIPNTGEIAWTNPITGAQTLEAKDTVPLVEPAISITESNNSGGKVHGTQIVEYKLKPKNAATGSTAFDTKVVEVVPVGLSPCTEAGKVLAEGEETASKGVWNATKRTITWEVGTLVPGAESSLPYFAVLSESPVANTKLTDKATVTTTNIEGLSAVKRTAENDPVSGKPGYEAEVKSTIEVEGSTIKKKASVAKATIGEHITYTLEVTLPAHVVSYDETIIDALPSSLDFDEYISAECTSGCTTPETTVIPQTYSPKVLGSAPFTTTVAWFLGHIEADASARTIKLVYRVDVRSTLRGTATKVVATNKILNSAGVYWDKSQKDVFEEDVIPTAAGFEVKSESETATTEVIEPAVTLVKEAAVEAGTYGKGPITVTDGNTVHYKLKIANTGAVAAYGVEVKDVLPTQLTEVKATTNSAFVTQSWSEGKPEIRWKLEKPVAPNSTETVELGYEAKLVSVKKLEPGQEFTNAAAVSTSYFGVPESERNEKLKNYFGEIEYREYTGPTAAVKAKVALPTLTIEKAALEGAKYQASANAEVNQPFTWRVIVKNTSTVVAKKLKVSDKLPPNWEYIGGASFTKGGSLSPTESGTPEPGKELTWSTSIELAAGASTTLTYQAKPTLAAETNPGIGKAGINSASATMLDAAENPEDAKGLFSAGPAQASGVLVVPVLEVTKTPTKATIAAGENDSYDIRIHNSGGGVAREVALEDTLPAGMIYTAKTATASPSTGFSELSASGSAVSWAISSIVAGATVEITVPVKTEDSLPSTTKLKNVVVAHATAAPTPVEAVGTITLTTSADVSAAKKIVSAGNAIPGKTITYEVTATNNGASLAHEVKLVDHLTTGLSYLKSSAGCKQSAGVVTCEAGTLEPGHGASFQIEAQIADGVSGSISNTVIAESPTPDPEPKNNEATATATAHPQAELELSKTAIKAEVVDGQDAAFTLTATNQGPSDAAEAKVIDHLPTGLSYVSSSGATCSAKGQEVTCLLGTLLSGAHTSFELVTKAIAPGKLVNSATVSSTAEDPEPLNNTATAEVKVAPAADLQIEKTASPTSVKVGKDLTYTLLVVNHGPDAAQAVIVTDDLPAGETYLSNDAGCTVVGQAVTCALGELANGKERTIHLVVEVGVSLAKSTVTNTAAVTSSTVDLNESNNESHAEVKVEPAADLSIEKTALPTSVNANGEVTYTLLVVNHGPDAAQAVVVTDDLPAGETYVSNDAGCTVSGEEVTCAFGEELLNKASQTIHLVVRMGISLANSTVINAAEVKSTTPDPHEANNKSQAEVAVVAAADLKLTKTASPGTVNADGEVTYTLGVSNAGPDAAKGVVVTDELPTGVTYVSNDGGCSHSGQTLRCELHEMLNGATKIIHVVVGIPVSLAEHAVTNTAEVGSETFDPVMANNVAMAEVHVEPAADLSIEKTASPTSVNANGEVTYTLLVVNHGPDAAQAVVVTDDLPAGETYLSNDAGCTVSGQKVTCALGNLASGGEPIVIEIVASVSLSLAESTVSNTAKVSSPTFDPDLANNKSTAEIKVSPAADLALEKTVTPGTVEVPGEVTYTLTAINHGPDTAHEPVITDVLPTGESFRSGDLGCTALAQTVTCTLADLASGATDTVDIKVLVSLSLAEQTIVNHASISSQTFDPEPKNNEAQAELQASSAADLSLLKTAETPSVLNGQQATFSLEVTNHGPSTAAKAMVTDVLPAGLSYVSSTENLCSAVGQTVTCELGTMANGETKTVKLTVGTSGAGPHTNTAQVSSETPDPEPANNKSSAPLEVLPAADLSLEKTVTPTVVELPGEATYTLTIYNKGPDAAQGVVITDPLPTGETYVSDDGGCTVAAQKLTCALGELPDEATRTIHLHVSISASYGEQAFTNTAEVTSSTGDPKPSDNVSSVPLQTGSAADVALTKTASATVQSGAEIIWTITVIDHGPSTAHDVTVVDSLPAGVAYLGSTPSQGSCVLASGKLTCELGTIASGASAQIAVNATVTEGAGMLQNTASVSAKEPDPEPDNNSGVATTTILASPSTPDSSVPAAAPAKSGVDATIGASTSTRVTVRKLVLEHEVAPGGRLDYRLIVHNGGAHTAEKLRVCDSLPEQTTVLRRGGGHLGGARICFTLSTLAPGHSHTFTIVLRADSDARGRIVNHATVTGSDFDPAHAHASTPVSAAGAVPRSESRVTG